MKKFKCIIQNTIYKIIRVIMLKSMPELSNIQGIDSTIFIKNTCNHNKMGKYVKFHSPYHICNTEIGDYTYIAHNAFVSETKIGKFCSIGPNFLCGWGIHPTNGVSTSPMFYSSKKQNGMTLSLEDKIKERKEITIGNDVFIGANVTILDGVTIGDGAVIGAGAVVSKNIPPYAIAAGCPIKILRYRFDAETISNLLGIKWWNFDEEKLRQVENYEFEVEGFMKKNSSMNYL